MSRNPDDAAQPNAHIVADRDVLRRIVDEAKTSGKPEALVLAEHLEELYKRIAARDPDPAGALADLQKAVQFLLLNQITEFRRLGRH